MGPTMTIDIVQLLIYLGTTAAGYLVSHYGVLGKIPLTKPNTTTPTTPTNPLSPTLQNLAQVVEQQLMAVLTNAVKGLLQQQVVNVQPPQQPIQQTSPTTQPK